MILWCADPGETLLCVYNRNLLCARVYKCKNHNFRIPCGWKYARRKLWEKLVCLLAGTEATSAAYSWMRQSVNSWIFEKAYCSKVMAIKSQYANEQEKLPYVP